MKPIVGLLLLVLGCASEPPVELVAETEALVAEAAISTAPKRFRGGESQIEGRVTITNKTAAPHWYANEYLLLSVNEGQKSRAYMQTIASMMVDGPGVELDAHDSLEMAVYWVFDGDIEVSSGRIRLWLKKADNER